jgi:peptide deformylase
MRLKIVTVPDPVLRKKSREIKKVDKKLFKFIDDLGQTLVESEDPPGVGISAPQVGKSWRILQTYLKSDNQIKTYINPKIIKKSKTMTWGPDKNHPLMEGCLSIPKIYGPVERHQGLTLKYQQIDPETNKLVGKTQEFKDFPARVIQHEVDHLNGVLFTDRVKDQGGQIYVVKGKKLVPIRDRLSFYDPGSDR